MKIKQAILYSFVALASTSLPAVEPPQETNTVVIDNFSFIPQTLTVPAGTKVTWINRDDVPHTVVSVDKQFKSHPLDTDEKFSRVFNNPGTNDYFCSIHSHMTGKIIVVNTAAR
jgi:plastocyanin